MAKQVMRANNKTVRPWAVRHRYRGKPGLGADYLKAVGTIRQFCCAHMLFCSIDKFADGIELA